MPITSCLGCGVIHRISRASHMYARRRCGRHRCGITGVTLASHLSDHGPSDHHKSHMSVLRKKSGSGASGGSLKRVGASAPHDIEHLVRLHIPSRSQNSSQAWGGRRSLLRDTLSPPRTLEEIQSFLQKCLAGRPNDQLMGPLIVYDEFGFPRSLCARLVPAGCAR